MVIGNKIDLFSERKVRYEDVFEFCESLQIPYIETSCKENINVEESFLLLIYQILSSIYKIPPIMDISINEKWDEEIHLYYPKSFKASIFTFVVCLNLVGFKKHKFPKFVLFEIIKKICFSTLSNYVNHFSKHGKLVEIPSPTQQEETNKKKKNKKDCQLF